MRVIRSACIAVTLAFGAVLVPAQKSVEEFTFRITAELEAVNPEAAQIFRQANEARDRLEFGEAEDLYRRVMALAPGFIHAKRRLAWMALFQGRRDEALRLTGEILPVDDSSENRAARIGALLDAETPKLTEIKEAVRHAEEMMGAFALDWTLLPFVCEAAIADQNQLLLSRCVTRLQRTAPYEIATYLYGWTLDLANGHHKQAKEKLDLAREAGLDEEAYDELSATTRSARPPLVRLASFGWRLGAVWLGGLLTLLALGITLSRMTLRAATQVAGAPSGAPVGLSATLRNFYRGVLWATCSYYFLSLPIVVLAVIGLGAAALLFILSLELIPIKLVALIIGVVAVTVIAVVRSLFIRPPEMDPGELLDMETQPKLRGVLDEVALEIDTRPVDNVYLTPGTDLAVMERGGVFRQMRGTSERCLILGVGVLDDMRVGPFKAILGHEYGHFSNRDTAGGGFALAVTRSIHLTAEGLAEGGAGGIFNPTWLFLIGFNWVFLVVSQGASRLQEILADRWAVMAYGARQFERGLRHVIEQTVRFDARAQAILEPMFEAEVIKVSPNFYSAAPEKSVPDEDIGKVIEAAINAESSLADSHPSPAQRFEYIRSQNQAPTGDLSNSEEEVWSLFSDREGIQRTMSRHIWQSTGMVSDGDLEAAYA